jgi:hypothetical protein
LLAVTTTTIITSPTFTTWLSTDSLQLSLKSGPHASETESIRSSISTSESWLKSLLEPEPYEVVRGSIYCPIAPTGRLYWNMTPWHESASEIYRPKDRRLSAKLVPNFEDRLCHVVSLMDP